MYVIASLVAKITFVVAEINFKVVVMTSLVVKITFVYFLKCRYFFLSGYDPFSGQDHFCIG